MSGYTPHLPGVNSPSYTPVFRRGHAEDFFSFSGSATADAALWHLTAAGTPGSNNGDIQDNARGGVVIIETGATATNTNQYQWNGSAFLPADDRKIVFTFIAAIGDIDQSTVAFGLIVETDTEVLGGSNQNGVYFYTSAADGGIDFHVGTGSAETEVSTGITVADGEFHTYTCVIHKRSRIEVFVDDVLTNRVVTTNLSTDYLTPFFQVTASGNASEQLLLDYFSIHDLD